MQSWHLCPYICDAYGWSHNPAVARRGLCGSAVAITPAEGGQVILLLQSWRRTVVPGSPGR